MTRLKKWTLNFVNLFHLVKDENLSWQISNQEQQAKLKQARIFAEQALAAELQKKSIQLAHDIALLKTRNRTELLMLKTRCEQDIKDYKQYLNALDQLKQSIRQSYAHLPEAVAFTIHHHAKQLLNEMWEADDFEQKMQMELRLIQFMATVHEDVLQLHLDNGQAEQLPQKTLDLIRQV